MAELFSGMKSSSHPDIGTAWLVLSHGAFLAASIASTALSIALLTYAYSIVINTTNRQLQMRANEFQQLSIGWNVVSFIISTWTVYAVLKTWQSAEEWPVKMRIFDDFGFSFLMFVTLVIAVFNFWCLHLSLQWFKVKCEALRLLQKQQNLSSSSSNIISARDSQIN